MANTKQYYVHMVFQANGTINKRYLIEATSKAEAEKLAEKRYKQDGPMRLDCYADCVGSVRTGERSDEKYMEV